MSDSSDPVYDSSNDTTPCPKTGSNPGIMPQLKRIIPWVKYVVITLVIIYVIIKLRESWDELSHHTWELRPGWLIASGVFFLLGFLPAATFWRSILLAWGQKLSFFAACRAYYISQLGKYTPGKAMVVILRSDLVHGKHVRASFAAAAVFFETFTMMSVGAFLAAFLMLIFLRDHQELVRFLYLNVAMLVMSCLPTIPPVFRFIAKKLGVGKGDPELDVKLRNLNFQTIFSGWFLMTISWVLFGFSLYATVRGVGIDPGPLSEILPKFIAIMSMSVVLGFVLMLPAGVGAREWVLLQFLTPIFIVALTAAQGTTEGVIGLNATAIAEKATGLAVVVAGAQRVVTIIAELLIAAIMVSIRVKKD